MQFEIRKISNYGTSHPVVARLGLQSMDLIKCIDIAQNQKDALSELYITTLKDRLLSCYKASEEISKKIQDALNGMPKQAQQRVQYVPHVHDLQADVETFLYRAKNFLRDQLGLFQIVYNCPIKKASCLTNLRSKEDGELVNWAKKEFGPDDYLCKQLQDDSSWIAEVIRMRNAIEHPGGHSGNLEIQNIRRNNGEYYRPTWKRTDCPARDILQDMALILENFLTFSEELVVHCITHKPAFDGIEVQEVPEDRRDKKCPVRLRIGLTPEMLANLPQG